MVDQSTIAAIATAIVPQQGSVGIVRLSGPEAVTIAQQIFHAPGQQEWESHRILYGYVKHPNGRSIDEALLLLMRAPRSYTREDVVELHCHGGMMAVQEVLQLCLTQGAQLAEPGEFTLRAFLNGRIDLTQAESIADLVGARSPQAAQTALAGCKASWRSRFAICDRPVSTFSPKSKRELILRKICHRLMKPKFDRACDKCSAKCSKFSRRQSKENCCDPV
jgi:tRNA U34 5-carboxymethylaminomethyl modifying GTPase MnmE/TrmE